LIFLLDKGAMKSFPPGFSISLEVEFTNGKKISSDVKCTKK
jgi:hypothetical protein